MNVISNNFIPFRGFMVVNIFGILFVRKKYADKIKDKDYNHELIHTAQMKELLYIFFYVIYILEWICRLIFHTKTAYIGISFEREAFENENNLNYLNTRKHFAQWRKLKTK